MQDEDKNLKPSQDKARKPNLFEQWSWLLAILFILGLILANQFVNH